MPHFVLLYHECPPDYERASHWDLMLESGDVLRTWAVERLPCDWEAIRSSTAKIYAGCAPSAAGNVVSATLLGDHRTSYLQFEGRLSGDRGTVVRVAAGTYSAVIEAPGCWRVRLAGKELSGGVELRPPDPAATKWMLECLPAD